MAIRERTSTHAAMAEAPGEGGLIFLHVPKTAGVSFDGVLRRNYARSATFAIGTGRRRASLDELISLSEEQRASLRLVTGHVDYGIHRHLPHSWSYISMLRDPVRRVVSHYQHARRHTDHYSYTAVVPGRMTLRDYVESGISLEVDNGQTRQLSGHSSIPFGQTTQAMLQEAKENVERQFVMLGMTERFDAMVVACGMEFGWSRLYYETLNAAPAGLVQPDDETLAVIEDRNRLDLELYSWARTRFDDQWGHLGRDTDGMRKTARRLEVQQRIRRAVLKSGRLPRRAARAVAKPLFSGKY